MMTEDVALGSGTRFAALLIFLGEVADMLNDMRWYFVLLILLLVADFRYGWGESAKHYEAAREAGDEAGMEKYRWHTSRAVRRTFNKLADYIVMMLLLGAMGESVLEQAGVEHEWGAWAGAIVALYCEVTSIFGHFFYLRGVDTRGMSVTGFLKAFAVALVRHRNAEVGDAVEEALDRAEKDKEKNEKE